MSNCPFERGIGECIWGTVSNNDGYPSTAKQIAVGNSLQEVA